MFNFKTEREMTEILFPWTKKRKTFKESWPSIRQTVRRILRQQHVGRKEWQDMIESLQHLCTGPDKVPQQIYTGLRKQILSFIKQTKIRLFSLQDDQVLLKTYAREWTMFSIQCIEFPQPYEFIETKLKRSSESFSEEKLSGQSIIRAFMHDSWNLEIFSEIKHRLLFGALTLVQAERNGDVSNSWLIATTFACISESLSNFIPISIVDDFKLFNFTIEKDFIEMTEKFYLSKAEPYLEEYGVKKYMHYANQKLDEENERCYKYLESISCSIPEIMVRNARLLITVGNDILLVKCPEMIFNNEIEELQMMYNLFNRVSNGINPILSHFEQFIIDQGLVHMRASARITIKNTGQHVTQLLELFTRVSKLVKESFNDDPRFYSSRDQAFEQVVNNISEFHPEKVESRTEVQPKSCLPILLANFCDLLSKKHIITKRLSSDEIEEKLNQVVLILKYVQHKDLFMNCYKTHLTRRLLLDSSTDREREKDMVQRLRNIGMPADSVKKMITMFEDIKSSEAFTRQYLQDNDMNRLKYKNYLRGKNILADSISVKILRGIAWIRSWEAIPVALPTELDDYISDVDLFYNSIHEHRKLQWCHKVSTGTITFSTKVGKFDLEVTTFQLAVLFVWNEKDDKVSFEDLRLATELPEKELRKTLWSLVAVQKLRRQPLLFEPEAKSPEDFNTNTLFWVNDDFAIIKNGRILKQGNVNLIGKLQVFPENCHDENTEHISNARLLKTQEAIVRVMKMRRTVTYAQLHTEVVEILKSSFFPSERIIQEQIQWLIENEYISRDGENNDVFIYQE